MYRARDTVGPMARLRFGCSGWDYQEWIGPFYRNASESKLSAYARVFDTAEINSTFYRAPSPGMVIGWGKYTPEDFVFAAKVPQTARIFFLSDSVVTVNSLSVTDRETFG